MAIRYWSPTVVHDDGAPPARVGNIGALELWSCRNWASTYMWTTGRDPRKEYYNTMCYGRAPCLERSATSSSRGL